MAAVNNPRNWVIGLTAIGFISAAAQPGVMKSEGEVNDPYWDIAHVRTVCYGETKGIQERHYSHVECVGMLDKSLQGYARRIVNCAPERGPLEMYAAFTSFSYNVGSGNACSSVAMARWKAGDLRGGCQNMMNWISVKVLPGQDWPKWCPANGTVLIDGARVPMRQVNKKGERSCLSQGLANRRTTERDLCLKGVQS